MFKGRHCFHTLKSDTLLSAVSRVTSQSDYSHTDKTGCPASEGQSVTGEENGKNHFVVGLFSVRLLLFFLSWVAAAWTAARQR